MDKKYLIRVYAFTVLESYILRAAMDTKMFTVVRKTIGQSPLIVMMDVECGIDTIRSLETYCIKFLPLNNYEDFTIRCPKCGMPIDDDMRLLQYDEHVLKGENIRCGRYDGCGYDIADVTILV